MKIPVFLEKEYDNPIGEFDLETRMIGIDRIIDLSNSYITIDCMVKPLPSIPYTHNNMFKALSISIKSKNNPDIDGNKFKKLKNDISELIKISYLFSSKEDCALFRDKANSILGEFEGKMDSNNKDKEGKVINIFDKIDELEKRIGNAIPSVMSRISNTNYGLDELRKEIVDIKNSIELINKKKESPDKIRYLKQIIFQDKGDCFYKIFDSLNKKSFEVSYNSTQIEEILTILNSKE